MRLAFDHHYSPVIARELRSLGHDAVAVSERDWQSEDDEALLALCTGEGRALLTNNVADFEVIMRRWHAEGRSHAGVIYTSDARLPRVKATIGAYVEALSALILAHPGGTALADRTHWLRRAAAAG